MSAHSSGTGASWNEAIDIDQPHGLDFREWDDIRIGVRKRMSQEHASFADSTVGGIHKPGGAAVLGIDDNTATVIADGTYRGHGLVWDGSVNLWCWTKTAGITDTPGVAGTEDWTILKMHPDKQWGGQDITWTGGQEFDASIDITGKVQIDGTVNIFGVAEFSDAFFDGSVDISGALDCSVFSVDGSADFSDVYVDGDITVKGSLKVDGTSTEFGGTAGIGLFYDPTVQTSVESMTFPNGLIFKNGTSASIGNNTILDIVYGTAFPNAFISGMCVPVEDGGAVNEAWTLTPKAGATTTTLQIRNKGSVAHAYYWQAWGR